MHWLDKLLIFLASLVLVVVGITALLTGLGIDFKQPLIDLYENMQNTGAGLIWSVTLGGLFIIIGFYLAGRWLGNAKSDDNFILTDTEFGNIRISDKVIKAYADRAAKTIEGVVDVKTSVKNTAEGINIFLELTTKADVKTSDIAKVIQERVLEYVADTVGTKVATVEVNITGIEAQPKPRLN